jgi:hypothetical protein
MSIRASKLTMSALLCIVLLLGGWVWHLHWQMLWANLIDEQCQITQKNYINEPTDPGMLALRLDFLMGYYDGHIKTLEGSRLQWMVWHEYQQTLTNAVAAFRSTSTNDLGDDPRAWIKNYRH